MRCKNCGWENPDGISKCERCSSQLERTAPSNTGNENKQMAEASINLRATIRESASGYPFSESQNTQTHNETNCNERICHNCGYNMTSGMNVCPQCGAPQKKQSSAPFANKSIKEKHCTKCGSVLIAGTRFCPACGQQLRNSGTVNAWDNPQSNEFCSLRPIAWSRENTQYNAISYSGERIVLNRANTDPNNQSITSHEQAVLTNDGKDWYIEDLSEQHSTMLRISKKNEVAIW